MDASFEIRHVVNFEHHFPGTRKDSYVRIIVILTEQLGNQAIPYEMDGKEPIIFFD